MTELDEDDRPSASEALDAFRELCDRLTTEQLQTRVDCKWTNGELHNYSWLALSLTSNLLTAFWPKHLPEPEYD